MLPSACWRSPRPVKGAAKDDSAKYAWRALPVRERLEHALVHGQNEFITEDTEEMWQALRPMAAARCT